MQLAQVNSSSANTICPPGRWTFVPMLKAIRPNTAYKITAFSPILPFNQSTWFSHFRWMFSSTQAWCITMNIRQFNLLKALVCFFLPPPSRPIMLDIGKFPLFRPLTFVFVFIMVAFTVRASIWKVSWSTEKVVDIFASVMSKFIRWISVGKLIILGYPIPYSIKRPFTAPFLFQVVHPDFGCPLVFMVLYWPFFFTFSMNCLLSHKI